MTSDLAEPFKPLAGALQGMVDRAVAAAVQQAEGLLRDHYALYHRVTAGGGGGWTLLAEGEVTDSAGDPSLRLPASGSVATTYGTLVLEVRARSTYTGSSREYVTLTVNDETGVYYASTITRNDVGTVTGFASNTDNNWDIGPCPKATAPSNRFGMSVVQLPMYARTDSVRHCLAHGVASTNTSGLNAYAQFTAGWIHNADTPSLAQAAIASVQVKVAWGDLAQGTLARLWGVTSA